MRESVPTSRYSPVCNVLRQWKTSLILTYRVYRLYDTIHFKNEQRSKDAAAKKRPNTSGVEKINRHFFFYVVKVREVTSRCYICALQGLCS